MNGGRDGCIARDVGCKLKQDSDFREADSRSDDDDLWIDKDSIDRKIIELISIKGIEDVED